MARPKKDGLDYYPMDSDIGNDDKIKYIRSKHGNDGFATVILLLNKIYKEKGYYCNWSIFEKTIFSVDVMLEIETLDRIINSCLDCRFFDKEKYEKYEILTSKGIQNRFMEASRRRKGFYVYYEYIIDNVDINRNFGVVNVDNNSEQEEVNADESGINRERGKERGKGKEEKGKGKEEIGERKEESEKGNNENNSSVVNPLEEFLDYFQENIAPISPVNRTDLEYDFEDFDEDVALLKAAVDICSRGNKRNYKYFAGILKNWRAEGTNSYAKYLDKERKFQDSKTEIPEVKDDGLPF